jgi:hypothetical protein
MKSKQQRFIEAVDSQIAAGNRTIIVATELILAARDDVAMLQAARSRGGKQGKGGRPIEKDTPAAKANRERVRRFRAGT